jgi:hypothetical protein
LNEIVDSGLEICLAQPDVFFGVVIDGNGGFVYDSADLTMFIQWALVGFSVVACLCEK